ncbi:DNA-binding transcriptional MerR regulator [Nocardia transvalensis]|uniref:DNA-binding transcriptional MerR regulator n=1 Tax=Nocardia transvalensis TaxID=37333 RepID=A0A7W9UGL5_9NOCA|nr:MerR family transcriptional regulator [Nocardia transvalensis]MBB5912226.1 DNA-binding transcriptional MerR regulator [Nocardia transvalensis]
MAWSTRQLADLAGTSLRTVRHYHDVGLLAEPERSSNGYKQYGVPHLVRLLRIKRLTDLGFSLNQIAEMGDGGGHPEEALRALDADLAATIERLQRVRVELSLILRNSSPTDLPADLAQATVDAGLSDNDRSFVLVMTRVLSSSALDAYKELLRSPDALPSGPDFDRLAADADERTRSELAERLLPEMRALLADIPELTDTAPGVPDAAHTIRTALTDLYNPAQVDVMQRVGRRLGATTGEDQE